MTYLHSGSIVRPSSTSVRSRLARFILGALFLNALMTCGNPIRLEQAPNLAHVDARHPVAEVPASLRTTDATIFYVTDRKSVEGAGFIEDYSYERSASMVFGESWVEFGKNLDWEGLVARSTLKTAKPLSLQNLGFLERIRFESTPIPFSYKNQTLAVQKENEENHRNQLTEFKLAIGQELRETDQRDAIIFLHGFNTEFQDALSTTAALWHYSGRFGLPISYSWPAGNPGLFKYFKDREAGEFSIFHLKEFLRALALVPELGKIHLIAHSRGADVLTSALRELVLVERAAGRDPRRSLKIDNLILAAPDLDFGVTQQRLIAEHTLTNFGQTSIYLNPNDGALGLAQRLATGTRFGRLVAEDLTDAEAALYAGMENVNFINVEQAGGRLGHSYFRQNPAVFSDIVLTMRTGALPGTNARPLENVTGNFWTIHEDYPAPRPQETAPSVISENE